MPHHILFQKVAAPTQDGPYARLALKQPVHLQEIEMACSHMLEGAGEAQQLHE